MDAQFFNLKRKVDQYKEVLKNTREYREVWKLELKEFIKSYLSAALEVTSFSNK